MTETIDWVRYDEAQGELVIQLTGGGAACKLRNGMRMETAVVELRTLCNRLADGVATRAEHPPVREGETLEEYRARTAQRRGDEHA